MKEELKNIVASCLEEVQSCCKEADLLNIKAKYLGKKSKLTEALKNLKDMSLEDKKQYGVLLNKIKLELENAISERLDNLNNSNTTVFDETLPIDEKTGSLHPITITAKEVTDILKRMGFTIVSGPEMDTEFYNFVGLNIPSNHPARDMQDTFWLGCTQSSATWI